MAQWSQDSRRLLLTIPPDAVENLCNAYEQAIANEKIDSLILIPTFICDFLCIHPFYDGNGRTARILTTLILHQGGYDLKGIYNLEEYYYQRLQDYYNALAVGPSHNYYMGRAEADITGWIEFFVSGMLYSFQSVQKHLQLQGTEKDQSHAISALDARQKQALVLFEKNEFITSKDVEELFHFAGRTARQLLQKWARQGFVVVADPSKKARKYKLNK